MRRTDTPYYEQPKTRLRAQAFDLFCTACEQRGLRVTLPMVTMYDPADRQDVDVLEILVVGKDTAARDPVNLRERVLGDINLPIKVLSEKIGILPAPA